MMKFSCHCEQEIVKKYGFSKVLKVTAGGKERYDSVYAGLFMHLRIQMVRVHSRRCKTVYYRRDGSKRI